MNHLILPILTALLLISLNPDRIIPLDIQDQQDNQLQLKVFSDIILHEHGAYRFHLVNRESHERLVLSYNDIEFELPVPVRRKVMISDFTQKPDGKLLITETNTNGLYLFSKDHLFEKIASFEEVPFSVSYLEDRVIIATNDFEHEYLITLDQNYQEVSRLVIGRSFFSRGVRSYDRSTTGNAFFIYNESLYVNTNEGALKKCGFSENQPDLNCETILENREHLFLSGNEENGFFYIVDYNLYSSTSERPLRSKNRMNAYNSFLRHSTQYMYHEDSVLIFHD